MKDTLKRYLQEGRDALLWKLDGLGEYDIRRPLTPTATNLLGLVKHTAAVEAEYLGVVFGRPFPEAIPYLAADAEANADMWATAEETRAHHVELYQRIWAHSDATIDALDLDAPGTVPWWRPGNREVTLHQILIHMIAETHRHAGQADIVRESIDGAAGLSAGGSNLPETDPKWWAAYRERVEQAAHAHRDGTDS
ncbi:DinB family protein [Catellatospora paridis]|uniref:DinB family protein n=1 Tax=Catellatospora paridis TaxID=1617086 RepID=UPI001E4F2609|nr:DinB family protein [Catellatospora paridis]